MSQTTLSGRIASAASDSSRTSRLVIRPFFGMRLAKASSCRNGIAGGGRQAGSSRTSTSTLSGATSAQPPPARRGRTRAPARRGRRGSRTPRRASRSRRARADGRRSAPACCPSSVSSASLDAALEPGEQARRAGGRAARGSAASSQRSPARANAHCMALGWGITSTCSAPSARSPAPPTPKNSGSPEASTQTLCSSASAATRSSAAPRPPLSTMRSPPNCGEKRQLALAAHQHLARS